MVVESTNIELPQVALKYLYIRTTSSASEKLFSTAEDVASSFRDTLRPDEVDMLMSLSKNYS